MRVRQPDGLDEIRWNSKFARILACRISWSHANDETNWARTLARGGQAGENTTVHFHSTCQRAIQSDHALIISRFSIDYYYFHSNSTIQFTLQAIFDVRKQEAIPTWEELIGDSILIEYKSKFSVNFSHGKKSVRVCLMCVCARMSVWPIVNITQSAICEMSSRHQ